MKKSHLVTDRQAAKMHDLLRPGDEPWVQDLLFTRAACEEKLEAVSRVLDTNDDGDFWAVVRSIAPFLAELHGEKL